MKNTFIYNNSLYGIVFITGACVLVIEVLATRILTPYFGTTIFTISSVIGVVLAALSAGYYIGGRIADKAPNEKILFNTILISGFSVFGLQIINLYILPIGGYLLSMTVGPPVFSILLFFLPAFLLGTVSPYIVTLQHKRRSDEGVGKISGNVFFWGTIGSLLGTFLAGFYLIPTFGIKNIITGIALILITLGLLGLNSLWAKKGKAPKLMIVLMLIIFSVWLSREATTPEKVIFSKDGKYDRIQIIDTEYNGSPARILMQDATLESAIYTSNRETAFAFNNYYELYKLVRPSIDRALVIGGGAMTIPRLIIENSPETEVEVVEIEPALFDISHKYFNVPKDERLHEIVEDGRRYLHSSTQEYDLIYLDAYRGWSVPAHLTTIEFLELAKQRLSKDGVLIANLIGNIHVSEQTYAKTQIATWKQAFPNSLFFAAVDPDSPELQNLAAIGFNTDQAIDSSIDLPKIKEEGVLSTLNEHLIPLKDDEVLSDVIFTDDYAPVEWLLARDLQRSSNH
jgi:spermidine synthase